jgi:hypothetical protein
VDHVDVEDRVGAVDGPGLAFDVEQQRGQEVRRARGATPGADAFQVGEGRVRRLSAQRWEGWGEEGGVLASAARDLEDEAGNGRWQDGAQHVQDRTAVAVGGGGVQAAAGDGFWVERHRAVMEASTTAAGSAMGMTTGSG